MQGPLSIFTVAVNSEGILKGLLRKPTAEQSEAQTAIRVQRTNVPRARASFL
jgi:hypothetical protein